MSRQPSGEAGAAAAEPIAQQVNDIFEINAKSIIPIETSSYGTVDFSRDDAQRILYSGSLSQCIVVLIRNQSPAGKYDNVVTMMHFFPLNAIEDEAAEENFNKGFEEFLSQCPYQKGHNVKVSIIGGAIFEGEEDYEDTEYGSVVRGIQNSKYSAEFTLETNEDYLTHDPERFKIVFVNKDGEAIIENEEEDEFTLLTDEIPSMPTLPELLLIHQNYNLTLTGLANFTRNRAIELGNLSEESSTKLLMQSRAEILAEYSNSLMAEQQNSRS